MAGCLRRDCGEVKRPEPKHSSEGRRQGRQRAAGEEEEVQGKGPTIAEALSDGWIMQAVMTRSRWGKGALIPAQPPGAGEGTEG